MTLSSRTVINDLRVKYLSILRGTTTQDDSMKTDNELI